LVVVSAEASSCGLHLPVDGAGSGPVAWGVLRPGCGAATLRHRGRRRGVLGRDM